MSRHFCNRLQSAITSKSTRFLLKDKDKVCYTCTTWQRQKQRQGHLYQSSLKQAGRSNSHFLDIFLNFYTLIPITLCAQTCWNDKVLAGVLQPILDLGRRWSIAQTDVARTQSIQTWSRSLWEMMGLRVGLGATRNRAKSLFAVQTLRPSPLLYSRNLVIFFLTQNHAFSQIINEKGHKSIWKLYLLLLILCIYVSYNI